MNDFYNKFLDYLRKSMERELNRPTNITGVHELTAQRTACHDREPIYAETLRVHLRAHGKKVQLSRPRRLT